MLSIFQKLIQYYAGGSSSDPDGASSAGILEWVKVVIKILEKLMEKTIVELLPADSVPEKIEQRMKYVYELLKA